MIAGRREALVLGGVAALAAAAGLVAGALALQSRSGAAALLSAAFPDLSGRMRRLSEWRGMVVVCNFWATWCLPCREEMPMLAQTRDRYAAKGVEIVGIGIDSASNIAEFAKTYPVSYPLLVAGPLAVELMRQLGNSAGGLPFTAIVDRGGVVAYRHLGTVLRADLERVLGGLLQ